MAYIRPDTAVNVEWEGHPWDVPANTIDDSEGTAAVVVVPEGNNYTDYLVVTFTETKTLNAIRLSSSYDGQRSAPTIQIIGGGINITYDYPSEAGTDIVKTFSPVTVPANTEIALYGSDGGGEGEQSWSVNDIEFNEVEFNPAWAVEANKV